MEQATQTSHRETMLTLPQVSAEAYASMSEAVSDGLGELVSTELDWAVDVEPMRAMTTFDLWMALATGDLPRAVRVWKLGRERWQPAEEVPELACALNLQRPELFPFGETAVDETPPATVTELDPNDDDVELVTALPPPVALVANDDALPCSTRQASNPARAPEPIVTQRVRSPQRDFGLRRIAAAFAAVVVTSLFVAAAPRADVPAQAGVRPLVEGRATVLAARTTFDVIVGRADRLAALPTPGARDALPEAEKSEPSKKKKKRVVAQPRGQKRAARTGKEPRGARGLKPAR